MSEKASPLVDILVVDDNRNDIMLIEEAVRECLIPCNVRTTHDSDEAMMYLNKKGIFENAKTPDLIFLDLKMPGFSGMELLKVLKGDPDFKHIPVIIITASDDREDINEAYRIGANSYIVKPANFMKFAKTIGVTASFWLGIVRLPSSP